MKIQILCHDHDFKLGMESGQINGNTATCFHYCEAFKKLGWEAEMREYSDTTDDADIYLIASEWYAAQESFFKQKRLAGKKLIVWLGHFLGGEGYPYYDPKLIEADLFITTWKGEVVKKYEQETGKKVHYIPHAFGEDEQGEVSGDVVFAGNTYALRDEGIIKDIDVARLSAIHPSKMPKYYRGAKIALNFHGRFQLGEISNEPSTLAKEAGFALNERTFQTSGAGGFQLCQEHPLLKEIFNDEIVTFIDNADLKEKIAYWLPREQERKEMAEKAREVILKDHTYILRAKNIIYLLNNL
jgi:hypothetical protein